MTGIVDAFFLSSSSLNLYADWSITAGALIVCYAIERVVVDNATKYKPLQFLPVSGAHIIIGAVLAAFLLLLSDLKPADISLRYGLKPDQFIAMLLPPIIFAGCMTVKQLHFWRHITTIMTLAIVGTTLSTLVIVPICWLGGYFGWYPHLNIPECTAFAGLISATDPVACLAVFNSLGVGDRLFALVVGESLLNDMAAILIFDTAAEFIHDPEITFHSLFTAGIDFVLASVISILFGIILGVISAGVFKLLYFGRRNYVLQSLLFWLWGYVPFVLGQGIGVSGIVAQVFCGLLMRHYTFYNIHEKTQKMTLHLTEQFGNFAETLVYMRMGIELIVQHRGYTWFIPVALFANYCGRALSLITLPLLNMYYRRSLASGRRLFVEEKICTNNEMLACWHMGLRGAVALALAGKFPGHNRSLILTTVIIIVAWTVYVHGGTTGAVLDHLKLSGAAIKEAEKEKKRKMLEAMGVVDIDLTSLPPSSRASIDDHAEMVRSLAAMTATEENLFRFDNEHIRPFLTHYAPQKNEDRLGLPKSVMGSVMGSRIGTPGTMTPIGRGGRGTHVRPELVAAKLQASFARRGV